MTTKRLLILFLSLFSCSAAVLESRRLKQVEIEEYICHKSASCGIIQQTEKQYNTCVHCIDLLCKKHEDLLSLMSPHTIESIVRSLSCEELDKYSKTLGVMECISSNDGKN